MEFHPKVWVRYWNKVGEFIEFSKYLQTKVNVGAFYWILLEKFGLKNYLIENFN